MTSIRFAKMHGLGNDFILVDARRAPAPGAPGPLARAMCDRRRGVGADGLLVLRAGAGQGVRAEVWNADGSAGGMCGNGLRCLALLLESEGAGELAMMIEMCGRRIPVEFGPPIAVGMGEAEFAPERIPLEAAHVEAIDPPWFTVEGRRGIAVSMGNPHFAVFVDTLPSREDLARMGPTLERSPAFPERANIHFARVHGPHHLGMATWERGSGPTPACASGACAVLAAGVRAGLCERRARVDVPGGELLVEWRDDGGLWCAGPAVHVYDGIWPMGDRGGGA